MNDTLGLVFRAEMDPTEPIGQDGSRPAWLPCEHFPQLARLASQFPGVVVEKAAGRPIQKAAGRLVQNAEGSQVQKAEGRPIENAEGSLDENAEGSLRIVKPTAPGAPLPVGGSPMLPGLEIDVAEWEGAGFDWDAFDERMEQLAASTAQGPFVLRLGLAAGAGEGEAAARLARAGLEALNRCQRFMPRRNQASSHPAFDRLLARHRALHDLTQRRVRAAYARALDTWQWLLRLDPTADEAVQIAALLLGAERLAPSPGRPVWAARERAGDRRFADLGARRGAMVGDELLADCGIDLVTRVRVSLLIGARERRPAWGEIESWNRALLDDADALSLLCLWSPGAPGNHLSARPPRAFVSATLGCLRHESRGWLDQVRLHPAIAGAVAMERENPATPSAREAQLATVRAPLPRLVPVRRTPPSDRPIPA